MFAVIPRRATDPAAPDVLGRSAVALGDAERAAPDFHRRVAAVERWVGMMLDKRGPDDAIGLASRQVIALRGQIGTLPPPPKRM